MDAMDQQLDFDRLLEIAAGRRPAALSDWFALPLSVEQAQCLSDMARRGLQQGLVQGVPRFQSQLMLAIGRYWLSSGERAELDNLAVVARGVEQQALVALVTGQLLVSSRRPGGRLALERGFQLAAPLLSAEGYLMLMKRHALLASLGETERTQPPLSLAELVLEAQVIQCLRKGQRQLPDSRNDHHDTLD